MTDADTHFEIKRGKRGRIASLRVAVDAALPVDRAERLAGDRLAAECARSGVMPDADIHIEAQSNFLTGGMDVTAVAYVRVVKARRSGRAAGPQSRRAPGLGRVPQGDGAAVKVAVRPAPRLRGAVKSVSTPTPRYAATYRT